MKAANFLFAQGSKDGLTLGMVGQQLALTQALRDPAVAYDMRKFGWLGRFTPIIEVSLTWGALFNREVLVDQPWGLVPVLLDMSAPGHRLTRHVTRPGQPSSSFS